MNNYSTTSHPTCNNSTLDVNTSKCLCDCDTLSDDFYTKCNNDTNCIKKCYELKAQCYMNCLGTKCHSAPSKETCGCG